MDPIATDKLARNLINALADAAEEERPTDEEWNEPGQAADLRSTLHEIIHSVLGSRLILAEVADERARQDEKWGEQNHPDGTGQVFEVVDAQAAQIACQNAAGYLDWLHILREEVAEAFAEPDPARLRAELVQVAAVATAWIEAIDRRSSEAAPKGDRA